MSLTFFLSIRPPSLFYRVGYAFLPSLIPRNTAYLVHLVRCFTHQSPIWTIISNSIMIFSNKRTRLFCCSTVILQSLKPNYNIQVLHQVKKNTILVPLPESLSNTTVDLDPVPGVPSCFHQKVGKLFGTEVATVDLTAAISPLKQFSRLYDNLPLSRVCSYSYTKIGNA